MNYLGPNLAFLRKQSGKNQSELALQLKKRQTAISSWENNQSQPSIEDIAAIIDIFGITAQELLFTDLSNVQANKKEGGTRKEENVQENVQTTVQIKDKKGSGQTPDSGFKEGRNDLEMRLEEYKELVKTLSTAVNALDRSNAALTVSNAQLTKDVEKLESIIRLIKHGIPEVGGGSVEGGQKAVG